RKIKRRYIMKKFLLFVSTVFLSLLFVKNNVYAQELPDITMKLTWYGDWSYIQSNNNTYEFYVYYCIGDVIFWELEENEYYMIFDMFEPYKKGLDRRTNSYVLTEVDPFDPFYTCVHIRMTILKSIIDGYSGELYSNIEQFLEEVPSLYIKYHPLPDSIDYHAGYNDGYSNGFDDGFELGDQNGFDRGYNVGYDEGYNEGHQDGQSEGYNIGYNFGYNNGYNRGYNDGVRVTEPQAYQRGYDDGYNEATNQAPIKFMSNLHVWLVPAIIIVVIAGIFVGYRRERYHD